MKIRLKDLRTLIKEQVILEAELRDVLVLKRDKLVGFFKELNIDEDVTWQSGVNFDEMIDNMLDHLKVFAKSYASYTKLMPEETVLRVVAGILSSQENYGDVEKIPQFMKVSVRDKLSKKIADAMKMTVSSRGKIEQDEEIVLNVLNKILKSISQFKYAKKEFDDAFKGSKSQEGLAQLPDLFNQYGYSRGVSMINNILGNLTPISKDLDDAIDKDLSYQEKRLSKIQSIIGKDKRSGDIEFDDRFYSKKPKSP